jgi:hypothetical protein
VRAGQSADGLVVFELAIELGLEWLGDNKISIKDDVTGSTELQVDWTSKTTGTSSTYSVKVFSLGSGTIPEEAGV